MPPFARSLRQTQILILEILNIFLWLKFSSSLISNKIEHFENGSSFIEPGNVLEVTLNHFLGIQLEKFRIRLEKIP